MKHRKLTAKIIAGLLTLAIAFTGISFGDTVTANAAALGQFKDGSTVTLKPGDTKKLLVSDENGKDITDDYRWTSSDESIVVVNNDFVSDDDFRGCLELIASGNGTATITGDSKHAKQLLTMTVTVKFAKATAKQLKCTHKWKITRKATCERAGLKTCRLCKLQKSTKKAAHKWVNSTTYVTEYDRVYDILYCSGHDCPDPENCLNVYEAKGRTCPHECKFEICVQDYSSWDEAYGEMQMHFYEKETEPYMEGDIFHYDEWKNKIGSHGSWGHEERYEGAHTVAKKIKVCSYCGTEKE